MSDPKTDIKLAALSAKVTEQASDIEQLKASKAAGKSSNTAPKVENIAGKLVTIDGKDYRLKYHAFNLPYGQQVNFAEAVKDSKKMQTYLNLYPELFELINTKKA